MTHKHKIGQAPEPFKARLQSLKERGLLEDKVLVPVLKRVMEAQRKKQVDRTEKRS